MLSPLNNILKKLETMSNKRKFALDLSYIKNTSYLGKRIAMHFAPFHMMLLVFYQFDDKRNQI
jgi:hypothetical protein